MIVAGSRGIRLAFQEGVLINGVRACVGGLVLIVLGASLQEG